jgi:inner membrane protein
MTITKREKLAVFSQTYTAKILLLALLVLIMLIPLSMIQSIVRERGRTAESAENEVMEAWGGQAIIAGPVLGIPYTGTEETVTENSGGMRTTEIKKTAHTLAVVPKVLSIQTDLQTQIRKRGIFSVPLYSGALVLSGSFDISRALQSIQSQAEQTVNRQAPLSLYISLASQKGITGIEGTIGRQEDIFFEPGSALYIAPMNSREDTVSGRSNSSGVNTTINWPDDTADGSNIPFTITIHIQGGKSMRFLPIAEDTEVRMSANWSSPSFQGAFLPRSSQLSSTDFSAEWDVNYLSRDIPLFWTMDSVQPDTRTSLFGVNFFRAIDTYSLNTRAVKYAVLFLIIPFLTLFLLEIFTKKKIHPVPYILVGIGNILFYLLLLSLSEQMPFFTAYLIAASSVSAMLVLYSRSLLPSWSKTWYMGIVAVLSYLLFYAVLNVQSYALLIGSICAFAVTAFVMFVTRKFDWYAHEERIES